ncbi:natural killer cell receptor 2B4-like isoform X2 [Opisthocomus hoazin]|uniref:natural killer cell receptor 2B4-like isoform X2 n=1 Tax=Opisthocomus hoazin TaxID=30419 RepID=UPI003F539053
MHRRGGPRCPPALWVLLCPVLVSVAGGQGPPECREEAVSANGALRLLPEKPPQTWAKVEWRKRLNAASYLRILTAEKNEAPRSSQGLFSGRAVFQQETLSLQISPVRVADSGVYRADFEDASGAVTSLHFCVSVWGEWPGPHRPVPPSAPSLLTGSVPAEPIRLPLLQTRVLRQEQGWCNLSLVCAVPGAGNVSYSWSCSGDPPGVSEPQVWVLVRGDADPTVCSCNASNPVSWSAASTDVTAACRAAAAGLFGFFPWWAVAVSLGLALAISVALVVTCCWWRKRGKDPQRGDANETLTVYAENGTSEATGTGNTIYTTICTTTQGPSCPQEPGTCTIYSVIQPTRKPSSLKRKRLDPALVSTAYVEATGGFRRSCHALQTLPPAPASRHLS